MPSVLFCRLSLRTVDAPRGHSDWESGGDDEERIIFGACIVGELASWRRAAPRVIKPTSRDTVGGYLVTERDGSSTPTFAAALILCVSLADSSIVS